MNLDRQLILVKIKDLNDIEKIALQIAKEDLGTSFNIEKSIGFLNWIKKNFIFKHHKKNHQNKTNK